MEIVDKTLSNPESIPTSQQGEKKSISIESDPLRELQKEAKRLAKDFSGVRNRIKDISTTIWVVVIVLVVMVGAMIFSLQIAIWQSKNQQPIIIYR